MVNNVRRSRHDHSNRMSAKDIRGKATTITTKVKATVRPHTSTKAKASSRRWDTAWGNRDAQFAPDAGLAVGCVTSVNPSARRLRARLRIAMIPRRSIAAAE